MDEAGTGIPGARILVRRGAQAAEYVESEPPVRTDAEGRFGMAGENGVTVRSLAPGLVLVGTEAYVETGKEARLVMVPACPLRVRVVEESTARPVEGALVRAVTGMWRQAVFQSDLEMPAGEATTDAEGRATLGVEGGLVDVHVVPVDHAPALVARVNVPRAGRDVDVVVGRGGVVEGRVLDADGAPVVRAKVRLSASPLYRRETTSGEAGRYRFACVSGPMASSFRPSDPQAILVAEARGWASGYAVLEPPRPGSTVTADVRLRRARTVRGVARWADGRPAAGAKVEVEEATEDAVFLYVPESMAATVGTDGSFEFPSVPGGAPVSVTGHWAEPRLDVRIDVDVPANRDPEPVDLRFPDRSGHATVRVLDERGSPMAGVGLEIKSGGPVIATVVSATTDARGTGHLQGLPRDEATLHVRAPASAVVARALDAAALSGGEIEVRLEGGPIAGVVRGSDGSPARTRLRLLRLIGGCLEPGEFFETDEGGRFSFGHLQDGSFLLDLEDESLVILSTWPWIEAGTTDVQVWIARVEESSRYRFEVVLLDDSTGQPLHDANSFGADFAPGNGAAGPRFHFGVSGGGLDPGRFVTETLLPPGTYDVTFTAQGWRSALLPGVRIPRSGEPPTVRLDRGLRLAGRTVTTEGAPIAGVGVSIGGQGAVSGADGTFALQGLTAGRLEARTTDDLVLPDERRVVVPIEGGGEFRWVMTPAGALHVVLDVLTPEGGHESVQAAPLAGGDPRVVEDDQPLYAYSSDATQFHGARIGGLRPGRYRVEVRQGGRAWPAQEVEVRAGGVTSVHVPASADGAPK